MRTDFVPVLLGSDINVYGMARSFHEAYGIPSVAIGKGVLGPCTASSIVHVEVVEPRLEEDAVFVQTLLDFAKRYRNSNQKLLLVPCGDNYAKLVVRNQDALRETYAFSCSTPELMNQLTDKETFYRVLDRHGIHYPKTTTCSFEGHKDLQLPFDFPIVIKPSNSVAYWNCKFPHKKKVFVAQNRGEMEAILTAIYSSSYKDHLILQEYIPGDDSAMRVMNCYCGQDRKVKLISLGHALLEEHSPEGIGSYAAIISDRDDRIGDMIREFLEDVGYVGFANFDMKYACRGGQYKLFEMNPRQGRSSYFTTAAGYNLAQWLVEDVLDRKNLPCTVAENRVLWSLIPKGILYRYVSDPTLKKEAKALIQAGKYRQSYYYEGDRSFKRWVHYRRNQLNYYSKYRRYFGNKGLTD